MAVLPAEIPTGLITGQYYFVNEDNIDADTNPELTVVTGEVTFTASVKTLRMPSKLAVLVPLTFDAVFDAQGNLTPKDGTGIGIELPSTHDPLISETDYTWKVEFNLKEVATGYSVNLQSFDIQVPTDSVQDLSYLMPVDSSPGTITIQGGAQGNPGPPGPIPNITIGTVDVGTPVPVVGPQGPIGPKGDPGGIVDGTLLGASDNLNNVTTSGTYRTGSAAVATLANNYPVVGLGGSLVVIARTTAILNQEFLPTGGSTFDRTTYRRTMVNSVWGSWRAYTSTRTDETAGRAIYQWDELNNREQRIYGDTGRRDIKATTTNGWVISTLALQRFGNIVTLTIYNVNGSAATDPNAIPIPYGFRPVEIGTRKYFTGTVNFDYLAGNYSLRRSVGWSGLSDAYYELTWTTNDPWPTALPGTAVGTIPNL